MAILRSYFAPEPKTLIETCKLNAVESHAYISGNLTAIINGHKQSYIEALLPWNFRG